MQLIRWSSASADASGTNQPVWFGPDQPTLGSWLVTKAGAAAASEGRPAVSCVAYTEKSSASFTIVRLRPPAPAGQPLSEVTVGSTSET